MSKQILEEWIALLRGSVNSAVIMGITTMEQQGLLDDADHVFNKFKGGLEDLFSEAFYQDLSRWENEEMIGEQYKKEAYKFDNREKCE